MTDTPLRLSIIYELIAEALWAVDSPSTPSHLVRSSSRHSLTRYYLTRWILATEGTLSVLRRKSM